MNFPMNNFSIQIHLNKSPIVESNRGHREWQIPAKGDFIILRIAFYEKFSGNFSWDDIYRRWWIQLPLFIELYVRENSDLTRTQRKRKERIAGIYPGSKKISIYISSCNGLWMARTLP